MNTRTCTKCGETKEATAEFFHRSSRAKYGVEARCKVCVNKKPIPPQGMKTCGDCGQTKKATTEFFYKRGKNGLISSCKVCNTKRQRKYSQTLEAKQQRSKRGKQRRQTDHQFKLATNLRNRLWYALKGNAKSTQTLELLGCSIERLQFHLQSQFTEGMAWDNYGKWHIDHIIPCASFDLSDPAQQRVCFHYTNLQPLWARDNLSKGDKLCPIS